MTCGPAGLVAHGVVAPAMPFLADAIEDGRVPLHVLPYEEKSSLVTSFSQHVQDARRPFGMRTVVEGQVNRACF